MHFPERHSPLKKSSDSALQYKDIYSFQKTPCQLFSVQSSTAQQTPKMRHKFHLCFLTECWHDPDECFSCCYLNIAHSLYVAAHSPFSCCIHVCNWPCFQSYKVQREYFLELEPSYWVIQTAL